ncbi:hypothetical protein [Psychroserpens algicola]|uniref:YCII-related domain-containing protein n=1 Tax=Psychroserpens algicola TaxID=1719034 RepID=A0ABT0H5V6_9FLAO|nr:hypothetical protein [Psychroserpens algicola]MCK8479774.1 hypothetical protein [Psychroserpens algicola]
MQTLLTEYSIWSSKYKLADNYVGGFPLSDNCYTIFCGDKKIGQQASDSPSDISGYIHIKSEDFEEVIKIAKECPLVKFNQIEIRPTIKY